MKTDMNRWIRAQAGQPLPDAQDAERRKPRIDAGAGQDQQNTAVVPMNEIIRSAAGMA